jgi:hypothetical protein
VIFEWQTSRGRDGPEAFLKEFKGKLQTDGYAVYQNVVEDRNRPLLAQGTADRVDPFCWLGARAPEIL